MNIIRLKKLITELEQNPKDNKLLIKFYKRKANELLNKINLDIENKLNTISPFITKIE